jgi:hypothetical protein
MSDTDAEEIKRKISLCSSLLTGEVNGFHDDVIDPLASRLLATGSVGFARC